MPQRPDPDPKPPSTRPQFALQLIDEDESDGVAVSLHARFIGAVVDGLTRAARRLGAVLQRVDLRRGDDHVDAQLRFVGEDDRRLSLGQRDALMAATLEVLDRIVTPLPASRPSWLPG